MLYRGIRFTLRQGITPGAWTVVIHPPDEKEISQGFSGNRSGAELAARVMIERQLKRTRPASQVHQDD